MEGILGGIFVLSKKIPIENPKVINKVINRSAASAA